MGHTITIFFFGYYTPQHLQYRCHLLLHKPIHNQFQGRFKAVCPYVCMMFVNVFYVQLQVNFYGYVHVAQPTHFYILQGYPMEYIKFECICPFGPFPNFISATREPS